jgi:hypothetical protein
MDKKIKIFSIIGFLLAAFLISFFCNTPSKPPEPKNNIADSFLQSSEQYAKLIRLIRSDYSLVLPVYHYLKESNNKKGRIRLLHVCDEVNNEVVCYLKGEKNITEQECDMKCLIDLIENILHSKDKEELENYYKTGEQAIKDAGL